MQVFATLALGKRFIKGGVVYERNVEQAVTPEKYEELKKSAEIRVVSEGNQYIRKAIPRFHFRIEEPTKEEKVLEELKDVEDSLAPRKPGRPSKASD